MITNYVFLVLNTYARIHLEKSAAKLEQLRFASYSISKRVHKIFHEE